MSSTPARGRRRTPRQTQRSSPAHSQTPDCVLGPLLYPFYPRLEFHTPNQPLECSRSAPRPLPRFIPLPGVPALGKNKRLLSLYQALENHLENFAKYQGPGSKPDQLIQICRQKSSASVFFPQVQPDGNHWYRDGKITQGRIIKVDTLSNPNTYIGLAVILRILAPQKQQPTESPNCQDLLKLCPCNALSLYLNLFIRSQLLRPHLGKVSSRICWFLRCIGGVLTPLDHWGWEGKWATRRGFPGMRESCFRVENLHFCPSL